MTHTHAEGQGQKLLSSKITVETDGWTEETALPPVLTGQ